MFCWTRLLWYLVQSSSVFFSFCRSPGAMKTTKGNNTMPNQKQSLCQVLVCGFVKANKASTGTKTVNLSLLNTFLADRLWKKTNGPPKKRRKSVQAGSTMKIDVFQYFPLTKRLNFMGYVDQGVAYWRWSTKNSSWWKLFQISLCIWAPSFVRGD